MRGEWIVYLLCGIRRIKCFFNFHVYKITDFMPYKKECVHCKKKMTFIGYNTWIDEI